MTRKGEKKMIEIGWRLMVAVMFTAFMVSVCMLGGNK